MSTIHIYRWRVSHGTAALLACSLIMLAACATTSTSGNGTSPASSQAQRSQLAVHRFVEQWRGALRESSVQGSPLRSVNHGTVGYNLRSYSDSSLIFLSVRAVCDRDDPPEFLSYTGRLFPLVYRDLHDSTRVPRSTLLGYCPYWWNVAHSGRTVVQSLEPHFVGAGRATVRALRGALIDSLDQWALRWPDDTVTSGLLVRFALDQEDLSRADDAAARCNSPGSFCLRLRALVALHRDDRIKAESLFHAARTRSAPTACGDPSIAWLAPSLASPDARCLITPTRERQLWWLADPFWGTELNERRLEHERRQVDHDLRRIVRRDELLDYDPRNAEKPHQLLVRYGWPSNFQLFRSFAPGETGINYWGSTDDRSRPIGALNYSPDRYATVPSASILVNPTGSTATDWAVPVYDARKFRNVWPREHMRFPFSFRTSTEVQWARFYRRNDLAPQRLLIAAASPYADPETPTPRDAEALVWMSDPATRRAGAISLVGAGGLTATVRTPLQNGILSLEALPPRSQVWRARVGVPALTIPSDSIFLSDMLVTMPDIGDKLTPDRGLVDVLLPSLTFRESPPAIGLYWELYGAPPSDSIAYSLRIRRTDGQSLGDALLRVASFGLRKRDDPQAITWTVPPAATDTSSMRHFTVDLNVAALPAGRYVLEIEARGQSFAVRGTRREIELVR